MKKTKLILFISILFILSCNSYRYVATETVVAIDNTLIVKRGHPYYRLITDRGHVVLSQDSVQVGDKILIKIYKSKQNE